MSDLTYVFQSVKLEDDSRILVVMCFRCKAEIASTIVWNMPLCDKCIPKNTVTIPDFPSSKIAA